MAPSNSYEPLLDEGDRRARRRGAVLGLVALAAFAGVATLSRPGVRASLSLLDAVASDGQQDGGEQQDGGAQQDGGVVVGVVDDDICSWCLNVSNCGPTSSTPDCVSCTAVCMHEPTHVPTTYKPTAAPSVPEPTSMPTVPEPTMMPTSLSPTWAPSVLETGSFCAASDDWSILTGEFDYGVTWDGYSCVLEETGSAKGTFVNSDSYSDYLFQVTFMNTGEYDRNIIFYARVQSWDTDYSVVADSGYYCSLLTTNNDDDDGQSYNTSAKMVWARIDDQVITWLGGSAGWFTYKLNKWYVMEQSIDGSSLTCTLSETDGTQVGEAQITDDTYTEGYVGWMGWGNTADTKYYATYSIEEKR